MGIHKVLCVAALCLSLGGCAELSSTQRYAISSDAYSTAVESVANASRLDLVDREFLEDFDEVRRPARSGLDEWEDALLSGDNLAATARRRIRDWIDRMILMSIKATREGAQ